jgi:hypothetical protein
MDIEEEREHPASILRNIRNLVEETAPKEEKETPHIKETRPKASGASPESPIPQVSYIPVVNYLIPSYANFLPVQLVS